MKFKKCSKCKEVKHSSAYYVQQRESKQLTSRCKPCYKASYKHTESARNKSKEYYQKNKELISKNNASYILNKIEKDPIFKLKNLLKAKVSRAVKHQSRFPKEWHNILGCTIVEFRRYISEGMKEGMTLENHGEWHLDHIIPLKTASTEDEVIKLFHYTNYQTLWADDNWVKSTKLI
jgi:hypothetical protein